MKKCKWLDCQGNEFFPKQNGTPSLVKIEHKNTATLDSARSKKNLKSQFCNYTHWPTTVFEHMVKILNPLYRKTLNIRSSELDAVIRNNSNTRDIMPVLDICKYQKDLNKNC